jgi:probable rRNA maturation factor
VDETDRPGVDFSDRQDLPVDLKDLEDLARRTMHAEGVGDAELSVSLVTAEEIADLDQRYLGEPGPTDVLSFPQDDEAPPGRPRLLGDVVICPKVAASQNADFEAEMRVLLVHGILHLLGYDHQEEDDRRVMWERQGRYAEAAP